MCGLCRDERGTEGTARLVRRYDVRHLIPTVHRRSGLYREAASWSAVSSGREGTPAWT